MSGLDGFGAYQKALELFDLVVNDMTALQKDSRCYRLVAQQVGSADSICSNIEEGYGRLGRREYIRFLDIARGSARETQGRYRRMKHWLAQDIVDHRAALCGEVIAILTSSIGRLRADLDNDQMNMAAIRTVKEAGIEYETAYTPLTLGESDKGDGSVPLTLDP